MEQGRNRAQGCVTEYQRAAECSIHPVQKTTEESRNSGSVSCIKSAPHSDAASSAAEPMPNPFPGVMPINRCTINQISLQRILQDSIGTQSPDSTDCSAMKEQCTRECDAAKQPIRKAMRMERVKCTGESLQGFQPAIEHKERLHRGVGSQGVETRSIKEGNQLLLFSNDNGESQQVCTTVGLEVGMQQAQSEHSIPPAQPMEPMHVNLGICKIETAGTEPPQKGPGNQQAGPLEAERDLQVCEST